MPNSWQTSCKQTQTKTQRKSQSKKKTQTQTNKQKKKQKKTNQYCDTTLRISFIHVHFSHVCKIVESGILGHAIHVHFSHIFIHRCFFLFVLFYAGVYVFTKRRHTFCGCVARERALIGSKRHVMSQQNK